MWPWSRLADALADVLCVVMSCTLLWKLIQSTDHSLQGQLRLDDTANDSDISKR